MIVAIPMKLPSTANLREFWATKAKRNKSQRAAVALAMKARRQSMLEVVAHLTRGLSLEVTLCRVSPRELDDDNLASAFKSVRDEVARQLGIDDRSKQVAWRCIQATGPAMVMITIGAGELSTGATP